MEFDLFQILSAYVVLFAVIDPLGSLPIVLNLQKKVKIKPWVVTLWSYFLMLLFFFVGEWILKFFGVDMRGFAVAGSIILFLMALEMLLDVEIFNNAGPEGTGNVVPLAFPLFAGPAVFTTLLTIRTQYSVLELVSAITLNMVTLFLLLQFTRWIEKTVGPAAIYIVRKFFGIILMAIAVKTFADNISALFVV